MLLVLHKFLRARVLPNALESTHPLYRMLSNLYPDYPGQINKILRTKIETCRFISHKCDAVDGWEIQS
jgi:hypothetical protein